MIPSSRRSYQCVMVVYLIAAALTLLTASAFLAPTTRTCSWVDKVLNERRPLSRLLSSSNDDNERRRHDEGLAHLARRTDAKIFLTQRAIQSFIYLLLSTRDPHTVRWMEMNYGFKNMEIFHGTGALNLTKWTEWDSVLQDMLERPDDVMLVRARKRGRRHGGWSASTNPHLQEDDDAERFFEFEIGIEPASLVSRIMSVREKIANEWIVDLDILVASNDQILDSYHDTSATARDADDCVETEDENCIPTQDLMNAYTDPRSFSSGSSSDRLGRGAAFDRNAMMMLRNAIAFDERASSPYRKNNFDLLLLLATQESVHRLLREYQGMGEERKVSFEWLREFYSERVSAYFDGHQKIGRADDFLEELLTTPPSVKTVDGHVELVDTLRITEDIIRLRSEVGIEWKQRLASVPRDHMGLRKDLFARLMIGRAPAEDGLESSAVSETVQQQQSTLEFGGDDFQ